MQGDKHTAPLEKALLSLHDDMTLLVAAGHQALEVHLTPEMARGLALALLANMGQLEPWQGHADEELIQNLHALAFRALSLSTHFQATPTKQDRWVDPDGRAVATAVVQHALPALALIAEVLKEKKKDRNAQAH
jgi:hypothetical protein